MPHGQLTREVVKSIYASHAGLCAFCDCSYPASTEDGTPLLQIAHIRPSTHAGPRGDQLTTHAEVNIKDNLILLCPRHHMVIDALPSEYTVERVVGIRDNHISRVARILASAGLTQAPVRPVSNKPVVTKLEWVLREWERQRLNSSEEFWQQLFDGRPELLASASSGRPYKLNSKCYVGGKAIDNHGGNVIDFIAQNNGDVTLIEIKTPVAKLLGAKYRNNVYPPSHELTGAVTQALNSRASLLNELHGLKANSPDLSVHSPSIFLLIGDIEKEEMSGAQRRSFELFRNSLKDVVIRTYDELFESIGIVAVWMEPF